MEGKTRRPMSAAERAALEEHLRDVMGDRRTAFDALGWLTSVQGMGVVSVLLVGAMSLRAMSGGRTVVEGFLAGSPTASMLAVLYIAFALIVRKPIALFCQMQDEMRQDLMRGEVEVQPVEALAVVVVTSQDESELPSRVFDVGGGRLLYLEASDMKNLVAGSSDLVDRFEIVDAPVSKTCLGIAPREDSRKLAVTRTIGPLSAKQMAWFGRVDRFFEGSLESLEDSIGR